MEPLSPQDVSFLDIENEVNHMHIGSVGIFEGPPPSPEELLAGRGEAPSRAALPPAGPLSAAAARAGGVDRRPAFQPRLPRAPHGAGRSGRRARAAQLVGRVMSQQLDRSRPLWEMWVAEGLEDGRWALISKVHHCMVDGVSATDLLAVLLDSEREPVRRPGAAWTPAPGAVGRRPARASRWPGGWRARRMRSRTVLGRMVSATARGARSSPRPR